MSVWEGIKSAASDLVSGAVDEAKIFGSEYVSNIWGTSSPVAEEKASEAENIAAIPNAAPTNKAGTGALLPKNINWQAVGALAAVAAAVVMVVRSR